MPKLNLGTRVASRTQHNPLNSDAIQVRNAETLSRQLAIAIAARPAINGGGQSTMCVTLLRHNRTREYRLIITYSHYDEIGLDSAFVKDAYFGQFLIVADPCICHVGTRQNFLFERNMEGVRNILIPSIRSAPGSVRGYPKNRNAVFIGPYVLYDASRNIATMKNWHHAEMRAVHFADKHNYTILYIRPTLECCAMCHSTLARRDFLKLVPQALRGTPPPPSSSSSSSSSKAKPSDSSPMNK